MDEGMRGIGGCEDERDRCEDLRVKGCENQDRIPVLKRNLRSGVPDGSTYS